MSKRILVVCGPTASGKSAKALDIAQNENGVIINADAMQVYEELRILTARPTPEQEAAAPHRLYGVIPARKKCSAARWLELAKETVDETFAQKKLPIITGGTGLYIKALMEGFSPIPDIPDEVRAIALALWQEKGSAALKEKDVVMGNRLKEGDMQRHIRALEVLLSTGKSLADWQDIPRVIPYPDMHFEIHDMTLPREELYKRCDARFLSMMEEGALKEAEKLHAQRLPPDLPATRAVGVRELFSYIEGSYTIKEAIKKAQQATRNYAKRQITWFSNQLVKTEI